MPRKRYKPSPDARRPPAAALPSTASRSHSNEQPRAIPRWPGFVVAGVCLVVYLRVGVGQFGVRPSGYSHHTITAAAWLSGRTYATREEVEGAFFRKHLLSFGRHPPRSATHDELRRQYREQIALRNRRLSEAQIDVFVARQTAGAFHDWVQLNQRYYAYWPPMPAVIMLPFVIVSGANASDILAANLVGGATVLFVYLMLRELGRHWPSLTTPACAGLALFYGLGTCHFWQASVGEVWFLTQLVGTMFLVVAAWLGFRALRDPRWIVGAGVALGLGFLSRSTIILAAPMFAVLLWMGVRGRPNGIRSFVACGSSFAAVLLLCIGAQLALNKAKFGDWLDFGQGHLADAGGNPRFSQDFKDHGRFSPHFVARNAWYTFLNPRIGFLHGREHPAAHGRTFDPDGNSLFLISPLMLFLFLACRARWVERIPGWSVLPLGAALLGVMVISASGYQVGNFRWADDRAAVWTEAGVLVLLAAWATVCAVLRRDWLQMSVLAGAIPGTAALMLFHGTGFYSFGPRYLLDTLPLLLILAAYGMRGRLSAVAVALIGVSIAINSWGTYRFCLEQPP